MFADHVRIFVAAGAGGDGASSFRREAHVPRGGPDGGDGGHGGDVILVVDAGLTTLGDFVHRRHVRAKPGGRGAGRKSAGRRGASITLTVPPGTVIRVAADEEHPAVWLGELLTPGSRLVVAHGGRGGRGNIHFATATNRAPTHAEKGDHGDERWIELELKLIADIGLVGAPNAGKSTLLAALTAATPKIGNYPFTTTEPNLGVIELAGERRAVIADVPGLIEGASEGHGLGHEFLRHVERTRVVVGVVDGAAPDPAAAWRVVEDELREHDPTLLERPMTVVVTKQDLAEAHDRWLQVRNALRQLGHHPIAVSAHDGTGLDELRRALDAAMAESDLRPAEVASDDTLRVHRFDPLEAGWEVVAEGDGFRVRGRRIETTASRIDFDNDESRERFQRTLERMGIDAELRRQGATSGSVVRIGTAELEWDEES
jgi:GTP-binding protein